MQSNGPNDKASSYDASPFVAELYDHVVPYRQRADVDFYVDLARESGGPVLEIGCGTGRILIPTARTGIEMVGLDLSERMLAVCRQKLAAEPDEVRARVELVRADMRHFELARRFPLITVPFRAFQHLATVEDQLACLSSIRGHLHDGGRLVLDLFNPTLTYLTDEKYTREFGQEPEFVMPDGRKVRRAARLAVRDLFNQVNEVELIHYVTHPDGREERLVDRFQMRYLFRFEAEHLLVRAGFDVQALHADHDKSPYGSKYPGELIFVAERKRG